MKPYSVQLTQAAARDLDKLAEEVRTSIVEDLTTLCRAPLDRPPRVKRLRGFRFPLCRLRSGHHRILYRLDEAIVTVLRVIDRKDLERTLRRLRPGSRLGL